MKCKRLTEYPELIEEWDFQKNGDLRPEDFTSDSRRFVWWLCKSGHSWQARISDRMEGRGCPYDSGKRIHKFINLATEYPKLATEWDYEANYLFSPEDVNPHSLIKVSWRCAKGHEWKATVPDRRQGKGFCLRCAKELFTYEW